MPSLSSSSISVSSIILQTLSLSLLVSAAGGQVDDTAKFESWLDPWLAEYQPPFSNGYEYFGNDLVYIPMTDLGFCATYCYQTAECVGFVLATDVEGCWIKSAFENPSPNSNRRIYLKPWTTLPPTRKDPCLIKSIVV